MRLLGRTSALCWEVGIEFLLYRRRYCQTMYLEANIEDGDANNYETATVKVGWLFYSGHCTISILYICGKVEWAASRGFSLWCSVN